MEPVVSLVKEPLLPLVFSLGAKSNLEYLIKSYNETPSSHRIAYFHINHSINFQTFDLESKFAQEKQGKTEQVKGFFNLNWQRQYRYLVFC